MAVSMAQQLTNVATNEHFNRKRCNELAGGVKEKFKAMEFKGSSAVDYKEKEFEKHVMLIKKAMELVEEHSSEFTWEASFRSSVDEYLDEDFKLGKFDILRKLCSQQRFRNFIFLA